MQKKFLLAASVFTLLICLGIAGRQGRSAYAEGFTLVPSATKNGVTKQLRPIAGTIVGIKRLSPRVWLIALDNGLVVLVYPASSDQGPEESLSLSYGKLMIAYVNPDGDGHMLVARSFTLLPSGSPTLTPTGTGCSEKSGC
jgi:hypothetical protein